MSPHKLTDPTPTGKTCVDCTNPVYDAGTNLLCTCGIYFAYQSLDGDLVRPILPETDEVVLSETATA